MTLDILEATKGQIGRPVPSVSTYYRPHSGFLQRLILRTPHTRSQGFLLRREYKCYGYIHIYQATGTTSPNFVSHTPKTVVSCVGIVVVASRDTRCDGAPLRESKIAKSKKQIQATQFIFLLLFPHQSLWVNSLLTHTMVCSILPKKHTHTRTRQRPTLFALPSTTFCYITNYYYILYDCSQATIYTHMNYICTTAPQFPHFLLPRRFLLRCFGIYVYTVQDPTTVHNRIRSFWIAAINTGWFVK